MRYDKTKIYIQQKISYRNDVYRYRIYKIVKKKKNLCLPGEKKTNNIPDPPPPDHAKFTDFVLLCRDIERG